MRKIVIIFCILSTSFTAIAAGKTLEQIAGQYDLINKKSEHCMELNVKAVVSSKQLLGSSCGKFIQISSSEDPMGDIYCLSDLKPDGQTKKIKVVLNNHTANETVARISTSEIKSTAEATENIQGYLDDGVSAITNTLALTEVGFNLTTLVKYHDESTKSFNCNYKRK